MKKFSKLAGVTATVMAAAMVLSTTAMADDTFKIGGIGPHHRWQQPYTDRQL